jgi:tellurite resistance protein TerC
MLDVTLGAWAVTVGLVVVLLAIDLMLAIRRPHAVGFREAVGWSVFYIAVAIAFGFVFASIAGWGYGGEYFAGYIVEKSLSVDNLFVFVVIMTTFAVPAEHQQKVLIVGIVLALVLRVIFIAVGAALLAAFSFMFLLFGLLLVVTAVQLFRHRDQDPTVEDNALVAFARKRLPLTDDYHEGKLVTRIDGRRVFTPLFLVLIAVGSTDILFALDSIPAVFGVTDETFIVFAANAFALLGLRALYFLVTGLLDRLVYLSTGLSIVLGFIGVKLVLHWGHLQDDRVPVIATTTSLVVIALVLLITTLASVIKARRDPAARAHAGSLRGHRQPIRRASAESRRGDSNP